MYCLYPAWGDTHKPAGQSLNSHTSSPLRCSHANRQQALLNGISLRLGQRAALGEAVDGVQRGVYEGGVVLRSGKQRGTAGEEGQHGRTDVAIHSQGRFGGAETLL